ncbi:MAG: hypothetical protein PHV71_03375 [Eubacteriales bacterium]|nr:hypothetical protein [Eubacteriales bacterium]
MKAKSTPAAQITLLALPKPKPLQVIKNLPGVFPIGRAFYYYSKID